MARIWAGALDWITDYRRLANVVQECIERSTKRCHCCTAASSPMQVALQLEPPNPHAAANK